MLIRYPENYKSSEITPKSVYLNRREWMVGAGALAAGLSGSTATAKALSFSRGELSDESLDRTPHTAATTYNNFYEFGTGKDDPARYAHTLNTDPWSVQIDGLVDKPGKYALEDLMRPQKLSLIHI